MQEDRIAVVIGNLGSPVSIKYRDVYKFLKDFLSDRLVIRVNPLVWFFILHLFIIPFRVLCLRKKYQKIWVQEENLSLLEFHMKNISDKLNTCYKTNNIFFIYAFTYGSGTISESIKKIYKLKCNKIILLPLFPQYSTTSALPFIKKFLSLHSFLGNCSYKVIPSYHDDSNYISCISSSVLSHMKSLKWKCNNLLISFHSIPKSYLDTDRIYVDQCYKTGNLIKDHLSKNIKNIYIVFQSKFGVRPWVGPQITDKITQLTKEGVNDLLVVCPGFSCDCLETTEEIEERAKSLFLSRGGLNFSYVPCLNDCKEHIALVKSMVDRELLVESYKPIACNSSSSF